MIWNTNRLDFFSADCFAGMEKALPGQWQCLSSQKNAAALAKRHPTPEHFAVLISGGAGNGPLFPGYVADGLADAAVIGSPFAAPNAYAIYEAGKQLGRENGVLLLYNNFAGDYLNNDMAQDLLRMDGIAVETVISTDDIATSLGESRDQRGGRSGLGLLIKLAGACAKSGMSLEDAAALLRRANDRLGTISAHVDFSSGEIVYGAGFSGEPGIQSANHMDLTRCAGEAMELLLHDLVPQPGETLFLLVNRLRLTSYADSYIMANAAERYLSAKHTVSQLRVAAFSNIMDVYGFDFSILCMDAQMAELMSGLVGTDSFTI